MSTTLKVRSAIQVRLDAIVEDAVIALHEAVGVDEINLRIRKLDVAITCAEGIRSEDPHSLRRFAKYV